jgi:nucleoside-diphosphate-sugar epimerase
MRVAITGVAGDVGGFVARELAQHGHNVVGVDIREANDLPLDDMREADVEDRRQLEPAFAGCDVVIHLAAIREPGGVPDDLVFRRNALGTFAALEAAAAAGARRLVLASSEAVLGFSYAARRRTPNYFPIDEEHPLAPDDAYGLSKVAGEELCRGFSRRGVISTICLRTCYVWSLHWREDAIDSIVDPARGRRGLWAYVHARDAARAYRLACEVADLEHATLFIAADDTRSTTRTASLLAAHFPGTPVRRPLTEFASIVSTLRARAVLGFEPSHSWRDDLSEGTLAIQQAEETDGKELLIDRQH